VTTLVSTESVMEKTTKRCPGDASSLRQSTSASVGHETEVSVTAKSYPHNRPPTGTTDDELGVTDADELGLMSQMGGPAQSTPA
jgi:hypothetical protein